jgi:hypothetical protein
MFDRRPHKLLLLFFLLIFEKSTTTLIDISKVAVISSFVWACVVSLAKWKSRGMRSSVNDLSIRSSRTNRTVDFTV